MSIVLDWSPRAPYTAEQLLEILRILRDPENGCPWDKVQTHSSIRKNFLEETCEALEAIDADDKEACNAQFAEILAEQTALKKQKEAILQSSMDADHVCTRMKQAEQAMETTAQAITEWSENAVRQIVERVTVLSADEVLVRIKGGAEIRQRLER